MKSFCAGGNLHVGEFVYLAEECGHTCCRNCILTYCEEIVVFKNYLVPTNTDTKILCLVCGHPVTKFLRVSEVTILAEDKLSPPKKHSMTHLKEIFNEKEKKIVSQLDANKKKSDEKLCQFLKIYFENFFVKLIQIVDSYEKFDNQKLNVNLFLKDDNSCLAPFVFTLLSTCPSTYNGIKFGYAQLNYSKLRWCLDQNFHPVDFVRFLSLFGFDLIYQVEICLFRSVYFAQIFLTKTQACFVNIESIVWQNNLQLDLVSANTLATTESRSNNSSESDNSSDETNSPVFYSRQTFFYARKISQNVFQIGANFDYNFQLLVSNKDHKFKLNLDTRSYLRQEEKLNNILHGVLCYLF